MKRVIKLEERRGWIKAVIEEINEPMTLRLEIKMMKNFQLMGCSDNPDGQ